MVVESQQHFYRISTRPPITPFFSLLSPSLPPSLFPPSLPGCSTSTPVRSAPPSTTSSAVAGCSPAPRRSLGCRTQPCWPTRAFTPIRPAPTPASRWGPTVARFRWVWLVLMGVVCLGGCGLFGRAWLFPLHVWRYGKFWVGVAISTQAVVEVSAAVG